MLLKQNLALAVLLLLSLFQGTPQAFAAPANSLATHNSSQWEPAIKAFEASDLTNAPPKNSILFVGSSSIRMWTTLKQDFPGLPVVNRGFGGSQIADSVHFFERLFLPCAPRQVVVYAGGNDINAGKDPEIVFGDFVALAERIRKALPETKVSYISSAPNPQRWKQVAKVRKLNSLVSQYCRDEGLDFIDVFSLMLGPDGLPKSDIFLEDQLHMNAAGYQIWKRAVAPHLRAE